LGVSSRWAHCSGHSEPVDRKAVLQHIKEIQAIQEKVRTSCQNGKSLIDIQKEFKPAESALIEVIYNEVKK
jgi:hypothetical protein